MDEIFLPTKENKKVLINAANIHGGGGVQVAASFLYDLIHHKSTPFKYEIIASSEVARNLEKMGVRLNEFAFFYEENTYGINAIWHNLINKKSKHCIIFNIFGPHYALFEKRYQITGFAQPWIIDASGYKVIGIFETFKNKIKYRMQQLFFKQADEIIVELPHVKQGLLNKNIQIAPNIHVIYNCVSNIYSQPDKWLPLGNSVSGPGLKIGYIGRDYAHKNLNVLPKVKSILENYYKIDVTIYVTLNEEEWTRRSDYFRSNIVNLGSLNVAQCPVLYNKLDGVLFPSLLECFSATPVEALFMERPLFASNRHFVRDVCKKHAIYFDPLDPHDIALKIRDYFELPENEKQLFVKSGYDHVISMPTSKDRSQNYINLIVRSLYGRH